MDLAHIKDPVEAYEAMTKVAQTAEIKARLGERVNTTLVGGPDTIRQRIAAYEEADVQELVLRFVDGTNPEAIRRFAEEIFV